MAETNLNWIANFIWGIADDVLRDLYVRGKYRDVILPMTVLRRLDAVLEPNKQAVLQLKESLDAAGVVNQDAALRQAGGQGFYNTSRFTLRDLRARATRQQLTADFEAYLDGFSPNVQDILDSFEFRNQIPRLSKADALGTLIEKFLSRDVNLSPHPVLNGDGSIRQPGLDNHAMGTIFEELVRRFNEENNEEAGEHWTPRDAVRLMAQLIFQPIADRIESGTYLLYDGALGAGGKTVSGKACRFVRQGIPGPLDGRTTLALAGGCGLSRWRTDGYRLEVLCSAEKTPASTVRRESLGSSWPSVCGLSEGLVLRLGLAGPVVGNRLRRRPRSRAAGDRARGG